MKQQVLIISGGNTYNSYEDYIFSLKSKNIDLDKFRNKRWKENIQNDLGSNFDVILPSMPNTTNACYLEWKIWFEKIASLLEDNLILMGHSLGGIFLAKYLSENKFNKKIKALILISAPFDEENGDETLGDFNLTSSLLTLLEQCQNIFLVHSKDDNVVNFDQVLKYKELLPNARVITFEDKGHFNQETFPELVELIRQI